MDFYAYGGAWGRSLLAIPSIENTLGLHYRLRIGFVDRIHFFGHAHPENRAYALPIGKVGLASCWSMTFSENRFPLFGIMLWGPAADFKAGPYAFAARSPAILGRSGFPSAQARASVKPAMRQAPPIFVKLIS
jgi:hypothetical protein